MRTIILLRHAKAEQDAPRGGSDFDRVLADKGRKQLKTLPTLFQHCGCTPDVIIASPAARTKETAMAVHALFPESTLIFDPTLYLANADIMLDILNALPATIRSVCIVAHNPGLYELAVQLSGHEVEMPTLGMVRVDR